MRSADSTVFRVALLYRYMVTERPYFIKHPVQAFFAGMAHFFNFIKQIFIVNIYIITQNMYAAFANLRAKFHAFGNYRRARHGCGSIKSFFYAVNGIMVCNAQYAYTGFCRHFYKLRRRIPPIRKRTVSM